MSIIHNIKTKSTLDFNILNEIIEKTIENVRIEYREENVFYYWLDQYSARGLNVSIEDDNLIEIRNTIMSNKSDYILTNKIVELILNQLSGVVSDEEDNIIAKFPLFDDKIIEELELRDTNVIFTISKNDDVTINAPNSIVNFGSRLYKELSTLSKEIRKDKIYEIIHNCQYNIPNYSYGNRIQIETKESKDPQILKLLTNDVDCLIDKYDKIMLHCDEGNPIMITNKILNSILPQQWILYDEYKIAAPRLPNEEWELLKKRALELDIFNDFSKKK